MQILDSKIQCPYCFEEIWVEVDPSNGRNQDYIEDCQVCCKPIQIQINFSENSDEPEIQAIPC